METALEPTPTPLQPGDPFPDLRWPRVGGGEIRPATVEGWRILIVYRGRFCLLCKRYFKTLVELLPAYVEAGMTVMTVSADAERLAALDIAEEGWTFPVGYGLTVAEIRRLDLYVSDPRTPEQTAGPFAEPGLFVINPAGFLHVVARSNAPFVRPELGPLLESVKLMRARELPPFGLNRLAA